MPEKLHSFGSKEKNPKRDSSLDYKDKSLLNGSKEAVSEFDAPSSLQMSDFQFAMQKSKHVPRLNISTLTKNPVLVK